MKNRIYQSGGHRAMLHRALMSQYSTLCPSHNGIFHYGPSSSVDRVISGLSGVMKSGRTWLA